MLECSMYVLCESTPDLGRAAPYRYLIDLIDLIALLYGYVGFTAHLRYLGRSLIRILSAETFRLPHHSCQAVTVGHTHQGRLPHTLIRTAFLTMNSILPLVTPCNFVAEYWFRCTKRETRRPRHPNATKIDPAITNSSREDYFGKGVDRCLTSTARNIHSVQVY